MDGPHPISQRSSEEKDWPTPKMREFCLKTTFRLEMHFTIKPHGIDLFLLFHDGQQDSWTNFVNWVRLTVSNYLQAPRAQLRSQASRVCMNTRLCRAQLLSSKSRSTKSTQAGFRYTNGHTEQGEDSDLFPLWIRFSSPGLIPFPKTWCCRNA